MNITFIYFLKYSGNSYTILIIVIDFWYGIEHVFSIEAREE